MQMYLLFRDRNKRYYTELLVMPSWISSHVVPCDRIDASLHIIRHAWLGTKAGPSVPERDRPGKRAAAIPWIAGELTLVPRATIGGSTLGPTPNAPRTGTDYAGRFERRAWPSRSNLSISTIGHRALPIIRNSA
jgi:hypothetical protein